MLVLDRYIKVLKPPTFILKLAVQRIIFISILQNDISWISEQAAVLLRCLPESLQAAAEGQQYSHIAYGREVDQITN